MLVAALCLVAARAGEVASWVPSASLLEIEIYGEYAEYTNVAACTNTACNDNCSPNTTTAVGAACTTPALWTSETVVFTLNTTGYENQTATLLLDAFYTSGAGGVNFTLTIAGFEPLQNASAFLADGATADAGASCADRTAVLEPTDLANGQSVTGEITAETVTVSLVVAGGNASQEVHFARPADALEAENCSSPVTERAPLVLQVFGAASAASSDDDGLSPGAIVGIVLGSVAGAALVGGGIAAGVGASTGAFAGGRKRSRSRYRDGRGRYMSLSDY